MTEGLIDDEQGGFKSGRGCVDQIFILKEIGEKACEKSKGCIWVFWISRRHMKGFIGMSMAGAENV